MPGLVRKLLIFSAAEGLVLQSHGPFEHHRSIIIDYKTRTINEWAKSAGHVGKEEPRLESHGIIGLLTIASLSFVIAITKREQVAQLFGKPVFVITDVALVPLSSQLDANEAIAAAMISNLPATDSDDSEYSDSEDDKQAATVIDQAPTPIEDDSLFQQRNESNTTIAEDVARRKAPYGKFASEWFSKQVWGSAKTQQQPRPHPSQAMPHTNDKQAFSLEGAPSEAAETNSENLEETTRRQNVGSQMAAPVYNSTMSLLPKILRSVKMILSSRSYYFSYDIDLTRRRMGAPLFEAGHDAFLMPIIQGFVGQRTFTIASKKALDAGGESDSKAGTTPRTEPSTTGNDTEKSFLITLISRRSTKRSGLRYLRRGIDDEGNCANSVETEQILSSPSWDKDTRIRSFVQVRGSIPLYFSQTPYSLKPIPMFHNSAAANQAAFRKHFKTLADQYGSIQIATLINKHGTEVMIGDAYEKMYRELHDAGKLIDVSYEWFDFHAECRGMKFENVQRLVDKMAHNIVSWGETIVLDDTIQSTQKGVIRTNCMDCLDRTNVAQSAFGQYVLQRDLREEGFDIDLLHDESTNWFNTLWADNGDAISRQYASTAALKGDFTRTRKRNWRGQMNDLGLTLSRYYSNMVNDYFSQAIIDVLLGNVSWKIFEDFESTMMGADPGISVASAREAAIDNCSKIVIQGPNEDLIHGWALLSPAQENTLRTLPFEETVVLLTDAAVYCCKFDWNTEKVASYEKIDLRSISKIRHGTYITSTFTERQLDEDLNQGLVILFNPGKGDMIRVNTRSLQSHVAPGTDSATSVDGGTGILSWFSPKSTTVATHTMALKVIPRDGSLEADEATDRNKYETARVVAENISEEIRRAIEGPTKTGPGDSLVEEGDIISVTDAKRRTGYLEQLGHSLKRMVWT